MPPRIPIPHDAVADLCRRNRIRLSLYGSVLRDDFTAESDVDVLVEFGPEAQVTLFDMARMAEELSGLLGRKVDVKTVGFLSPYIVDQVLAEAEVQYVAP